ncbi:MAG: efflux RND transporter periplasmic adaptor subunit [Planctomycetaceae bacterium]|nr:efflux RND transporter periplasmic adaptor subunit [Planctomycetaceae bacterium]
MKKLIIWLIVFGVLGGGGFFGYRKASVWMAERNKPNFRTDKVTRGNIRVVVNATGEVKPVLSVHIGSFVSGPIQELFVDFNDEVKADQILATIDPRIYEASVERDTAAMKTREAEISRVKAELQRARNDEQRALALKGENEDFISQAELDQYRFTRMSLEAQLEIAEASVRQAKANLENSEANLNYTKIRSPVDGIVIDRKIDPGQTLAAQFQTPELFIVAPDMREKMHIFASIDEADIGLISEARANQKPVQFKVDAYRDEVFDSGVIEQIRLSSTTNQNVVTYPVVVATPNNDMKLLPGMTANLTFLIREHKDVVKIPNGALRYFPQKEHVRKEDQARLELNLDKAPPGENESTATEETPVDEAARAVVEAKKRVVWVKDGDLLKAVDVVVGESDYQFTHVVEGDLKENDVVVVGLKAAK